MKTNDERVAFPFDSELPGAVRFRIKPSRPGTRKPAVNVPPPGKPVDVDGRSDPLLPPQASAPLSDVDGVKVVSRETGAVSEMLPRSSPRYLLIAACICIAAAAFGASAGYYIVTFSTLSSTFQVTSFPSRQKPIVQQELTASEKMALKIAEMRKIASEESESTGTPVGNTEVMSSTLPGTAMAHSNDSITAAHAGLNPAPSRQCSAASMALALCGEK